MISYLLNQWWFYAIVGPQAAGAVVALGYGVYRLGRRIKRRLTWMYGSPRKYVYVERGISEAEAFANQTGICDCGCGQFIIRERNAN